MAHTQEIPEIDIVERWRKLDLRFLPIDELDVKILAVLVRNSRTSNIEIAKKLGIGEATVRKRIKRLEEIKVIRGYPVRIDYDRLENPVKVYITIKVESQHRLEVIRKLSEHPRSLAVYKVAGDSDILAVMLFINSAEYREFEDNELGNDIVKSVSTQMVISPYKGVVWSGA